MGWLKKLKKKKMMKKAIEETNCPIWFVTYCIESDKETEEGTLQIPANKEGTAMTKATMVLNEKAHGKPWTITSISCI